MVLLDMVVIATVKDKASKIICHSINYGINDITDGIKHYNGHVEVSANVIMQDNEEYENF